MQHLDGGFEGQHLVHVEHIVHRFVPVGTGCAGGVTRRRRRSTCPGRRPSAPNRGGGHALDAARQLPELPWLAEPNPPRVMYEPDLVLPVVPLGSCEGAAARGRADAAIVAAVVVAVRRTRVDERCPPEPRVPTRAVTVGTTSLVAVLDARGGHRGRRFSRWYPSATAPTTPTTATEPISSPCSVAARSARPFPAASAQTARPLHGPFAPCPVARASATVGGRG